MSIRNKTLYIALFISEAISFLSLLGYFRFTNIILGGIIALGLSLIVSWNYAYTANANPEKFKNLLIIIGLAFAVIFLMGGIIKMAIMLVAFFIILGINLALNDRQMLFYLLSFSFMLFLYGSTQGQQSYFFIMFAFYVSSFLTVMVMDYYQQRVHFQSNKLTTHNFTGVIIFMVLFTAVLTGALFYLLPQPKALHFGLIPIDEQAQYTDTTNKDKTPINAQSDLPSYGSFGQETSSGKGTGNTLSFYKQQPKASKDSTPKEAKLLFEVRGKQPQFLRGLSYDYFDGKTWQKKITDIRTIKSPTKEIKYDGIANKKLKKYHIRVKNTLAGKPIIYLPISTYALEFPSDTFYADTSNTMYAPSQIHKETFYYADVHEKKYRKHSWMGKGGVLSQKEYLQVPKHLKEKLFMLSKQVCRPKHNAFIKASRIQRYFRNHYLYINAYDSNEINNQTLEDVLLKSKQGNALQFNTAMVILLRLNGVYARLATGYSAGKFNKTKGIYQIKTSNAAVWTEVYIEDKGWMMFRASEFMKVKKKPYSLNIFTPEIMIFLLLILGISYYYLRPIIWKMKAHRALKKYSRLDDINFVLLSYQEVLDYYYRFGKGRKRSWTVQEYEAYLNSIRPMTTDLIHYASHYYNQAVYKEKLDSEFDVKRYYHVMKVLIKYHFQIPSFIQMLKNTFKQIQEKLRL